MGSQFIHLLRGGRTPSYSPGLDACRTAASHCSHGSQSPQFYRTISITAAQPGRRLGCSLPAATASLEALQIQTQGVSPWNVLIFCNTSEGREEHRCTLVKPTTCRPSLQEASTWAGEHSDCNSSHFMNKL